MLNIEGVCSVVSVKSLKLLLLSLSLGFFCCGAKAAKFKPTTTAALIAAINCANENGEDDIIILGCNSFLLDAAQAGSPNNCLPEILPDGGHTLTIQNGTIAKDILVPNLRCRHFQVDAGASLILDSVVLRDGLLAAGAAAPGSVGGSIYNLGSLSLDYVTFINNSADNGGAIYNANLLSVGDSLFRNNSANINGGGIYNNALIDSLFNTTFYGNTAGQNGGAIYNAGTINDFDNNTVAGNTAGIDGGGVANVTSGTIREFISNIVAQNTAIVGMDVYDPRPGIVLAQNNLIGIGNGNSISDVSVDPTDQNQVGTVTNPINPRLGPLQDNGGLVFTMALLLTSPAINAGANPLNLVYDARGPGYLRTRGLTDIGAYEVQLCSQVGDSDNDGICNDVDPCCEEEGCPDTKCEEKRHCKCRDLDHDGVCDCDDNCVAIYNPDQADRDHDNIGDVCDLCPDDPTNTCICCPEPPPPPPPQPIEVIEGEDIPVPFPVPVPVLPDPIITPPPPAGDLPPPMAPPLDGFSPSSGYRPDRAPAPDRALATVNVAPTSPEESKDVSAQDAANEEQEAKGGCSQVNGAGQLSIHLMLMVFLFIYRMRKFKVLS